MEKVRLNDVIKNYGDRACVPTWIKQPCPEVTVDLVASFVESVRKMVRELGDNREMRTTFRLGEFRLNLSVDRVGGAVQEELRSSFRLRLMTASNLLAEFTVTDFSGGTILPHRLVYPEYRGNGIGGMMLKVSEAICVENFELTHCGDSLEVDAGQVDVLVWLTNHGYIPCTPIDSKRLKMVFSGDERLSVDDECFVFDRISTRKFAVEVDRTIDIWKRENSLLIRLKKRLVDPTSLFSSRQYLEKYMLVE